MTVLRTLVADDQRHDDQDGDQDQHDRAEGRRHRLGHEARRRAGCHYLITIGSANWISEVRPASILTGWLFSPIRSCQALTL